MHVAHKELFWNYFEIPSQITNTKRNTIKFQEMQKIKSSKGKSILRPLSMIYYHWYYYCHYFLILTLHCYCTTIFLTITKYIFSSILPLSFSTSLTVKLWTQNLKELKRTSSRLCLFLLHGSLLREFFVAP